MTATMPASPVMSLWMWPTRWANASGTAPSTSSAAGYRPRHVLAGVRTSPRATRITGRRLFPERPCRARARRSRPGNWTSPSGRPPTGRLRRSPESRASARTIGQQSPTARHGYRSTACSIAPASTWRRLRPPRRRPPLPTSALRIAPPPETENTRPRPQTRSRPQAASSRPARAPRRRRGRGARACASPPPSSVPAGAGAAPGRHWQQMPCRGLRQRPCRSCRQERRTPGTANGVGVPQYALCDATVIWCSRKRTTSACSGRSRSVSAAAFSSASRPASLSARRRQPWLRSRPIGPSICYLVLQLHPALAGAAAGLAHESDDVGRPRAVVVLDEVRVHRRDARAAHGVALEAALLEQTSRPLQSPPGFSKTEPKVRTLAGCASLRRRCISDTVCPDLPAGRPAAARASPRHHLPGAIADRR